MGNINGLSKSFQEGVSFISAPISEIEVYISDDELEEDKTELKELQDGIAKIKDLMTKKINALRVDS